MATNKEEEITPYQLILDKEYLYLSEKIRKYAKLSPEYSTAKAFVIDLIERELENKQLDNTFIELDKPFYFNKNNLYENYTAIATTKKPKANTEEYIKITKVPNNLDLFNTEFNSYCYDNNKNKHLGIDLYLIPTKEALKDTEKEITEKDIRINYIAFEYDTEENIIEVDIIKPEYIKESIEIEKYDDLFYNYETKRKKITEEIASDFDNSIRYRYKSYLEDIGFKYDVKYFWKKIYRSFLDFSISLITFYEFSKENEEFFKRYCNYKLKEIKYRKILHSDKKEEISEFEIKEKDLADFKKIEIKEKDLEDFKKEIGGDIFKLKKFGNKLKDIKQSLLNENKEVFLEFEKLTKEILTKRNGALKRYLFLGEYAPVFDSKYMEIEGDFMLGVKLMASLNYIPDLNIFIESDLEELVSTVKVFVEERNKTLHGSF